MLILLHLELLTPEAKGALARAEQALRQSQVLRLDYAKSWQLILLPTAVAPTGMFWQNGPLEWMHLPATAKKVVAPYPGLVASLIVKVRKRSIELVGQEPIEIIVPYSKEQLDSSVGFDTDWQIALGSYSGQVLHHMHSSPIFNSCPSTQLSFQCFVKINLCKQLVIYLQMGHLMEKQLFLVKILIRLY